MARTYNEVWLSGLVVAIDDLRGSPRLVRLVLETDRKAEDGVTDQHPVLCSGRLALFIVQHVEHGGRLWIEGELQRQHGTDAAGVVVVAREAVLLSAPEPELERLCMVCGDPVDGEGEGYCTAHMSVGEMDDRTWESWP